MEHQRFDDLARTMATGTSRRAVLRGALGGALAAVGLRSGAAARADKVDICHGTGNGSYHWINVSVNALEAHLAHGDFTECDGNFVADESCNCVCDLMCDQGYELNVDACACELVNPCAGLNPLDLCGSKGQCATSADTGNLVCVNIDSKPPCVDANCTSSVDCTNSGDICVLENPNYCSGRYHCHPPA